MKPQIEIGTFQHTGHAYSALGSVVDTENGVIVGYPATSKAHPYVPHVLHRWDGSELLPALALIATHKRRCFGRPVTMYYWRAVGPDGRSYYGRNQGLGMLLTLRVAKGK